ncbi:hypothetical protein [Leptospira sp. GIMC2001]|uniref:hypothetical protein n=1 Tax=Leptospira sp. GIMC2001 TaxID=1513297 RepID=UPI0023495CFA|nr:hypothetical protein [Leptospira sp. GIMC2001]WCL48377.1 hypothetical protein O4O04_13820 [Leptospira sp. GIMC2001]
MKLERDSVLSKQAKIYLMSRFFDFHKNIEIQDLYKWLYYGEFGYEEQNAFLRARKSVPQLQLLLDQIDTEKSFEQQIDRVWEPMGCSHRFVMVYIAPYFRKECPLVRMVNLMERSPAFRGSRMQFKLDWSILKEYAMQRDKKFTKEEFYQFEDRIGFHQLPSQEFSEEFQETHPYAYRVVSQKLFFEYFPEFYDEDRLFLEKKSGFIIG